MDDVATSQSRQVLAFATRTKFGLKHDGMKLLGFVSLASCQRLGDGSERHDEEDRCSEIEDDGDAREEQAESDRSHVNADHDAELLLGVLQVPIG